MMALAQPAAAQSPAEAERAIRDQRAAFNRAIAAADLAQIAAMFNTINATQRKLPKALIETTRGDITEASDTNYAQQIRRLTFSLCRDDDSVWGPIEGVEQINMTGVRDPNRPVTYEGLRRSMSNMFPVQLLTRLTSQRWRYCGAACTARPLNPC